VEQWKFRPWQALPGKARTGCNAVTASNRITPCPIARRAARQRADRNINEMPESLHLAFNRKRRGATDFLVEHFLAKQLFFVDIEFT